MKDKATYNLIEGLDEKELLELDFDNLISEEELNSLDIDTNKIRSKTYKKIGKINILRYKNKKTTKFIASIALVTVICTSVALAFVNQLYKYDKANGSIIRSETPIYILKEPITKKVGEGEITLTSVLVNPEEGEIIINEEIRNIVGFKYIKEDIIVNDKNITNSIYERFSNYLSKSTETYFKYKENSEFKYVVTLMDSDKNITKINFDIELEEAKSVEEYNNDLSKDTKNNIVISAITKEDENNLYAELMAIPNIENFDFTVNQYGRYINDNNGSNIFLIDSKGNKVEGEQVIKDNTSNTFKFDTKGLQKPFTIEIDEIQINNINNKGVKVKLPKLKSGESVELNEIINMEDSKNFLTKENHEVIIKRVERKDVNKLDSYVLDVEYPANKDRNIKLQSLCIESEASWFGFGKFYFSSAAQEVLKDGFKAKITIYLQNESDNNYDDRNRFKTIKFKVSPNSYKVDGPWKLEID